MAGFIAYVENLLQSANVEAFTSHAIKSFLTSLRIHNFDTLTEDAVKMWIADMTIRENSLSTRKKYYSRMHNIHKAWRRSADEDIFQKLKGISELKYLSTNLEAKSNLQIARRLSMQPTNTAHREYIEIFLYLLFNPQSTLSDAIYLTKDKIAEQITDQSDEVIREAITDTHLTRRIWKLGQGKKRESQILRETISGMNRELQRAGMRFADGFSRESIRSIWIAAAIDAGVKYSQIKALICNADTESGIKDKKSVKSHISTDFPIFDIIVADNLSKEEKEKIERIVANQISDATPGWHVLRLRSGIKFEEVKKRVEVASYELGITTPEFYNPMRVVIKKDAKGKRIKEEKPYLPGIVFFRVRRDKTSSLIHKIGDIAWCYKTSNRIGAPYTVIQSKEMYKFQRHIAQFTPDIAMEFEDGGASQEIAMLEKFVIGDTAKIVGGEMLEGHEGVIVAIDNTDGTRTYTLRISTNASATWTARVPEQLLSQR